MSEETQPEGAEAPAAPRKPSGIQRFVPWVITIACFAYLYGRMSDRPRRRACPSPPISRRRSPTSAGASGCC